MVGCVVLFWELAHSEVFVQNKADLRTVQPHNPLNSVMIILVKLKSLTSGSVDSVVYRVQV